MGDMDEDRVYDDRRAATVAYLATGRGVATVRVSSDRVGRFALDQRCDARDIAVADDTSGADGRVYVATAAGVLAGPAASDARPAGSDSRTGGSDAGRGGADAGDDGFDSLGFEDAVAVTVVDGDVVAADSGGRVARYRDDAWTTVGTVGSDADVRALSGDFVAAADGVYRIADDDLEHVGLDDANDVTAVCAPLAATGDGLYRLGNGWLAEAEGDFSVVAAGGVTDAGGEHRDLAHAATDEALFESDGGDWTMVDLPVDDPVADVAYGECVYAVTRSGTFLVDADPETTADGTGGWRFRSLGLPDVAAVAVAAPT